MGCTTSKPGALSVTQATVGHGSVGEGPCLTARWPSGTASGTHGRRAIHNAWRIWLHPAQYLEERHRCSVAGRHQERGCARAMVFFDRTQAQDSTPQARGTSPGQLRSESAQLLVLRTCGWPTRATRMPWPPPWRSLATLPAPRWRNPSCQRSVRRLPEPWWLRWKTGFGYRWPLCAAPGGVAIRLVTSYATPQAHVDESSWRPRKPQPAGRDAPAPASRPSPGTKVPLYRAAPSPRSS